MKKNYSLFLVLFLCVFLTQAQVLKNKYSDYFKEGVFLIEEDNYNMALKYFLEAYQLDSVSANINYYVGLCYLNTATHKPYAEKYLAKATTSISKKYKMGDPAETAVPGIAYFYYSKALHVNYKFDEALFQLTIYNEYYAHDNESKKQADFLKSQLLYAKELKSAPMNIKIENFGDSVNSPYSDYSPVLSADESTLIYTRRKQVSTNGDKLSNDSYYDDIVISYKKENGKWTSPKSISQYINTIGNEGSINLSADGQTLIVYQDLGSGNGGDLYYSNWDGKEWSTLQSFGSDINTQYWEPHACVSSDNNTLYFVSDRPGGYGGRDIYRCVKLPNGNWSKAYNVGPTINTKYDEDGPFLHPDGKTFIFSSNGHKSMGGFDIFFSTILNEKQFSEPQNMGYPINTTDDDVFFVTSLDGKRGYFSSGAPGGYGDKDIYKMIIIDEKETTPFALFKGFIVPENDEKMPDMLEILIKNKATSTIVGRYKPKENGSFITILDVNHYYNFSYQIKGQEFYNEDVFVSSELAYQEIKKEIYLNPVNVFCILKK